MKLKDLITAWSLRLFLMIILNSFFLQTGLASDISQKIQTRGTWPTKSKDLTSPISIQASTDGKLLYIENMSPCCDIAINIVNDNGDIVYERNVPVAETPFIVIPLSESSTGSYQLELSSPFGGYLKGIFTILNPID